MEGTTTETPASAMPKIPVKTKKRYVPPAKKAAEKATTTNLVMDPNGERATGPVQKPEPKSGEKQFYHSKGWPRLWVTVHDDQMTSGMDGAPVDNFVSLNGYAYQIQRNQKIVLPEPVVRMMESLELMKLYRNEANEMAYRPVKRFSMTIHGPASMEA